MVVVGGLGTVWGTLIGTIVLYSLPEFIRYMAKLEYFPPEVRRALADNNYHLLIFGLVLAIFVLFFPRGLVGLFSGRRG